MGTTPGNTASLAVESGKPCQQCLDYKELSVTPISGYKSLLREQSFGLFSPQFGELKSGERIRDFFPSIHSASQQQSG